jgi:prephenate dehydrogenase
MWRDIVLMNRDQISRTLRQFSERLADFQQRLEKGDPAEIEAFFTRAKELRDAFAAKCASPSPE